MILPRETENIRRTLNDILYTCENNKTRDRRNPEEVGHGPKGILVGVVDQSDHRIPSQVFSREFSPRNFSWIFSVFFFKHVGLFFQ